MTPDLFRTMPCPTDPTIRLAIVGRRRVSRLLDAFAPDTIHIATEGPLGLAARAYCVAPAALLYDLVSHQISRISERASRPAGVARLCRIALVSRAVERCHGRDRNSAARTPAARLSARGSVDPRGRRGFVPARRAAGDRPAAAGFSLCRPHIAGKEPARFPRSRLARIKTRRRRWAVIAGIAAPLSADLLCRPARWRGVGSTLRRGGCVRVAEPNRDVWAGAAGGACLRLAGRGVAGSRSTRCNRRERPGRA